jgi:two-component system sensor histidine kinase AlgZ
LPNFCAAGTVLVVVLIAELIAILLTLASSNQPGMFLVDLARNSLFILWLAILSAVIMCLFRERLESAGKTRAFVLSFVLLEGLCLGLADLSFRLGWFFPDFIGIRDTHASFILRTFAISSIVIALAMRYLYVASEWRRSIVLEAQARISALQALIRPHFLFNSMNTIASLTRTDPRQAEAAVEDLSDLLRANLSDSGERTTLAEELEVAAIYQRIEGLRLGERLNVRWHVDALPQRALIPHLTIQPLLENAIYHGIELLPDGGEVTVDGFQDAGFLEISITNPVSGGERRLPGGHQMALDNIRQRFELAYGPRARVEVEHASDRFTVRLRFPFEERHA